MPYRIFTFEFTAHVLDYRPTDATDVPSIADLKRDAGLISEEIADRIQRRLPPSSSVIVDIDFKEGSVVAFGGVWIFLQNLGVLSGAIAFGEYAIRLIIFVVGRVLASRLKSQNINTTVNQTNQPKARRQQVGIPFAIDDPLTWIFALVAFNTILLILVLFLIPLINY
ncbi:MAG: hypothetical protein Kow00121_60640 [Elainellaceae cyanobacterium]